MFDQARIGLNKSLTDAFNVLDLEPPEESAWIPIPFSGEWGIGLPLFPIAAREARSGKKVVVPVRAQEIAESLRDTLALPSGFSRVEAVNGYLNLYYATGDYGQRVVNTVLREGEHFGSGERKNLKILVEFSQPNTHKALHVGHFRNMILGDAICRILDAAGYDVIRANYPGDTGLHTIKWMWNYLRNHAGETPGQDRVQWMGDIYQEANSLLETDPTLEVEMRSLFQRWEEKDPEIIALWRKTREWSIEGFNQVYAALDIPFDRYYWQSDVDAAGKAVVQELIDQGLAIDERPDGPVIVRLDELLGLKKERYRVMVALRSDGSALYSTWDLALAIQKFKDYDLYRSIYVVDVRQSLHLQQVYKTLELLGYPWSGKLYHLPYEIVTLPGNVTMASREGTIVRLEHLLRESIDRASQVVEEKNAELDADLKAEVAKSVALGALKFPMLARENTKLATFDWETALDFNGRAAPYIQYAHVRACSILRKTGPPKPRASIKPLELTPPEVELIDLISRIPDEVQRAADEYKTLHITNLSYEVAKAFTTFYNQCPVLTAEPAVREFRVRLVSAARIAIENLLALLGISAPQVM